MPFLNWGDVVAGSREMTKDLEMIRERNRILGIMSANDELTGLLNLRGFTEEAKKFCHEEQGQRTYLICGDLDHLKEINDNWGHPAGNFALRSVAEILRGCIRSDDVLARVGGDEFLPLQNIFRHPHESAATWHL